jgi:hypothetical protein
MSPVGCLPARRRAILNIAAPLVVTGPYWLATTGTRERPAATVVVIIAPASVAAGIAAVALAVDEIAAARDEIVAAESGTSEARWRAGAGHRRPDREALWLCNGDGV